MVTPDINKAMEKAKYQLQQHKEEDAILFYSKVIRNLLNSRDHDGPSLANDKVVAQLVSNQLKALHPFPYIDKCLLLAVWSDPMWNAVDLTPETSIDTIAKYQKVDSI